MPPGATTPAAAAGAKVTGASRLAPPAVMTSWSAPVRVAVSNPPGPPNVAVAPARPVIHRTGPAASWAPMSVRSIPSNVRSPTVSDTPSPVVVTEPASESMSAVKIPPKWTPGALVVTTPLMRPLSRVGVSSRDPLSPVRTYSGAAGSP